MISFSTMDFLSFIIKLKLQTVISFLLDILTDFTIFLLYSLICIIFTKVYDKPSYFLNEDSKTPFGISTLTTKMTFNAKRINYYQQRYKQ